jgi:DNA-binding SARP family transcriptional activator
LQRAGGEELRALLVQPKRLALFAYLLLANPPRLHRRDALVALFWPESSDAQARRALRQALHFLRQSLGPDVLVGRGDEEVGVVAAAIRCDVRAFEHALNAGRLDEALALYRGQLLEGFHVSGVAPELGQWLDDERARLRDLAVRAATTLAERSERDGNPPLAIERLRAVLRLDPGAEGAMRRLISLLDQVGDRAGAVRLYDDFVRRLAADIGAEPTPATAALAEQIRAGRREARPEARTAADPATAAPTRPAPASPTGSPTELPRSTPIRLASGPAGWRGRGYRLAGLALVLVAAAAASRRVGWWRQAASPDAGAVLAVGAVEDRSGADSLGMGGVLRDLLATDLARVPGVTVVSPARMQELLARLASGAETHATLAEAARRAGATEMLEGILHRRAAGVLRLDVRRVGIADGVIRRAYSAEGRDLFEVVEQLSAQVASGVGQPPPSPPLASLTTTSLVARRFYEEGVRAYYRQDATGALRLFRTALAEDSTFAIAAHFASRAAEAVEGSASGMRYAAHAVRMSQHATERERLLIATGWASATNSPSLVPLAESLARRFPSEPDAEDALGYALHWSGDFSGATRHLRRAVERDSIALAAAKADAPVGLPCAGCEAIGHLVTAYHFADSLAAAERAARQWIRWRPRSTDAWAHLAVTLTQQGRWSEALEALRTRDTLYVGVPPDNIELRLFVLVHSGDLAGADRLLAERARDDVRPSRITALWWQVISFRNQGRLKDALLAARRYNRERGGPPLPEAQVLFELGRPLEAAARFEEVIAIARPPTAPSGAPDSALGLRARHYAWLLTHVGAACAAAGDTVRLARLADSVEAIGARGAYGRDRRLHHHLRGLLLLARGDRAGATVEFRRAIHSPTFGYTRTNLELGRTLLALGRAREAAVVLAPALRGNLESSNYYVTHAELHEALAQAYDAAGQRDSARVHYAWVANAWRRADAPFHQRAERALARSR